MTTKEKAQNLMQIDDNNNPQFATLHHYCPGKREGGSLKAMNNKGF